MSNESDLDIIYGINDQPTLKKAVPLAFQHILAMFAANATLPLLISSILNLSAAQTTLLIQSALLMSGVTTLIQISRNRGIGSRLPLVMGTSNAFISTSLAIATDFGIGAVFGAAFIGGLVEFFIGKYLDKLQRFFPPLVNAIVVLTIGITLIPVGITQAAGSINTGSLRNLFVALVVLISIIIFHQSSHVFLKSSSILLGIVVGYVMSYFLGMVDFSAITQTSWLSFPKPYQFQWKFEPVAIFSMIFMYLATSIETLGDVSALTRGAEGREPTNEEMSGAIMADGLSSSLASLFNSFPNTSYTQNVGVVSLTGVFSRYIVKLGAFILLILSFVPKFSAIISVMPEPVLGGAAIAMFSMVAVSGISLMQTIKLNSRNMLIIAISLGLGVGLNLVPEATQQLPLNMQIVLTSGVVPAAVTSIILNVILPESDQ
ncbi:uracil permease [Halolactibacillus miurensis]|uniref:Uracil permease n=1 Tax=Halolactibacillus miurensis TaxID=306541 RepID=A0A1I6RHW5_9BACI|nr:MULTISPECIES: nucleobase:cation symporter-2 family protein [Halolactibacillus]GEM03910.1 uracil permease [Halolactibacillus miurensis]SFS64282.1 xanthine permease [Halolactibacillus miurensis]